MSFALVFPGQGSQSLGMMIPYGDDPVISGTFNEASDALGQDLWALATSGPVEDINQTVNTQPLMLAAGVAVWRLWQARGGRRPAVVAGHSLGEYAALVAAEVITLADAVPLVRLRARAMQEAVPVGAGAMAAILGLSDDKVQEACREAAQGEIVEAVNFNAEGQLVIAGHKAAVERGIEACKAKGAKRAVLLPVSAPFHSSLLRPAAEPLKARLAEIEFRVPRIPVLNNVDVAVVDDPAALKDALVRQAFSPVRWVETVRAMGRMGVTVVAECGPGKVLAGLIKRCDATLLGQALADLAAVEAAAASLE